MVNQNLVIDFSFTSDLQSVSFDGLLFLATKNLKMTLIRLLQRLIILLQPDILLHGFPQLSLQCFLMLINTSGRVHRDMAPATVSFLLAALGPATGARIASFAFILEDSLRHRHLYNFKFTNFKLFFEFLDRDFKV